MNRRRFLESVAGVTVLAGCLGDDEESDRDNQNGGDDSTQRLVEDETFPPVSEPASVPPEPLCGVCNMTPGDYPHSNAQVVHRDESRQFFCTPGCLATYSVATASLAETDAPIENEWARDASHESLVDAHDLYWVLDTNPDRGIDPMRNPLPYEDHDDALAWIDDHEDLSEDDIVTFDEITVTDTEEYRAFYIE